jgi:hypothetical protein
MTKIDKMMTKRHEHYFSPQADPEKDDVRGRFDAVESVLGVCYLFDVEAGVWTKMRDYVYACEIARMLAAGWDTRFGVDVRAPER